MKENLKQLLLKDLCARLPYKLYVTVRDLDNKECEPFEVLGIKGEQVWIYNRMLCIDNYDTIEVIRPFFRPLSSMTEDEREEYRKLGGVMSYNPKHDTWAMCAFAPEAYDWLNKKQFDYRGLVPRGLALEAPEGMYNTKTE